MRVPVASQLSLPKRSELGGETNEPAHWDGVPEAALVVREGSIRVMTLETNLPCADCHTSTPTPADFAGLPPEFLAALARDWRCPPCFTRFDAAELSRASVTAKATAV